MTDNLRAHAVDLETMWASLQTQLAAHRPGTRTEPDPGVPAVPVTLLTGFLGAGKSTLLASLLSAPPNDLVVRALVNDVGTLPIDPSLLLDERTPDGGRGDSPVDVVFSNGCGCCVITTDVAQSLDELATTAPDLIVFEASGVADPVALAQVVEAGAALLLDRIVAVVDGTSINRQLAHPATGPTARRQLDAANVVVVSHLDLVAEAEVEPLFALLAELAQGAVITMAPPVSGEAEASANPLLPTTVRGARPPTTSTQPGHDLVSVTRKQERPLNRAELDEALASLAARVIRAKGFLVVDEQTAAVQIAGGRAIVLEVADETEASVQQHRITLVAADTATLDEAAHLLGCG